jgi:hypothetical protein
LNIIDAIKYMSREPMPSESLIVLNFPATYENALYFAN